MNDPIISVTPEQWDEQYRSGSWDRLKEFTAHYAIIAALIRKYGCDIVLDVGCGQALLRNFLYPRSQYYGIDISPSAVLSANIKDSYCAIADADSFVSHAKWGCVVFCESLYYMPEPLTLLYRYLEFSKFSAISISVMPKTEWLIHWFATCSILLEDFHLSYGEHEHRIFMLKGKNG